MTKTRMKTEQNRAAETGAAVGWAVPAHRRFTQGSPLTGKIEARSDRNIAAAT